MEPKQTLEYQRAHRRSSAATGRSLFPIVALLLLSGMAGAGVAGVGTLLLHGYAGMIFGAAAALAVPVALKVRPPVRYWTLAALVGMATVTTAGVHSVVARTLIVHNASPYPIASISITTDAGSEVALVGVRIHPGAAGAMRFADPSFRGNVRVVYRLVTPETPVEEQWRMSFPGTLGWRDREATIRITEAGDAVLETPATTPAPATPAPTGQSPPGPSRQ